MSTRVLILKCQCGLWNDTRYDNECDCGKKIKEPSDICDGYDAVDSMVLDINKSVSALSKVLSFDEMLVIKNHINDGRKKIANFVVDDNDRETVEQIKRLYDSIDQKMGIYK